MSNSGIREKTRVSRMHIWLKAVSRKWSLAPDAETRRRAITTILFCVSRSEGRAGIHFFVSDSGVGIPKQKQQQIFDPFGQADSSTTRKFGGTGLGLTISRTLIELMDGRLGLESEEGVGTTFDFLLRFTEDTESPRLAELVPASFRTLAVLVVDDNATSRSILQKLLEGWQIQTTCVASAKEAMQVLNRLTSS